MPLQVVVHLSVYLVRGRHKWFGRKFLPAFPDATCDIIMIKVNNVSLEGPTSGSLILGFLNSELRTGTDPWDSWF